MPLMMLMLMGEPRIASADVHCGEARGGGGLAFTPSKKWIDYVAPDMVCGQARVMDGACAILLTFFGRALN